MRQVRERAPRERLPVTAKFLTSAFLTSHLSPVVTARPGHKIKLSKIDPDDTGGYSKEEALERFCELREKIYELQEILYAEHRRSLLLIFQAMDTGGKDGAIKDLCASLNPAGLEVRSFKAPSAEELDHDFLWRVHKARRERE
jgi:polyphosphate kinase 2 (PPK2 family)